MLTIYISLTLTELNTCYKEQIRPFVCLYLPLRFGPFGLSITLVFILKQYLYPFYLHVNNGTVPVIVGPVVPRDGAVVLTKESFVGPVFRTFGGGRKLVTQWSIMNPTTRLNMYNAYSSCQTTKDYKYNTYCIPKFSLVAKSTEHGANKGFFC